MTPFLHWNVLTHAGRNLGMLLAMQQTASSQPSPSLSSFAGVLATLASPLLPPATEAACDAPPWNSNDHEVDVATLSYERALRAHARYQPLGRDSDRPADRLDGSPIRADDPRSEAGAETPVEVAAADDVDATNAHNAMGAAPGRQTLAAPDRDLRSASVTIRLSKAECVRLHQRAAEAGLTVSAYLRSCAVEAETLRAQVKRALAELKAGNERPKEQGIKKPDRRNLYGWIRVLLRRGR